MSLSCSCDFEPMEGVWYWMGHSKWKPMPVTERRRRCCSCKKLINWGELTFEFYREVMRDDDVTMMIHWKTDGVVPLASWWMCEVCSGLVMALEELEFCYNLGESVTDQIAEYRAAEKEARAAELKDGREVGWYNAEEFM